MRPGDSIVVLGLLIWLTIAVGPWWIGLGLMALGTLANVLRRRRT